MRREIVASGAGTGYRSAGHSTYISLRHGGEKVVPSSTNSFSLISIFSLVRRVEVICVHSRRVGHGWREILKRVLMRVEEGQAEL